MIIFLTVSTCPECGNTSGNKINRRTGVRRCGGCDIRWREVSAESTLTVTRPLDFPPAVVRRQFVPTIWVDHGSVGFALGQLGNPGALVADRLLGAMVHECQAAGVLKSPDKVRQCFDRIWTSDDPGLLNAIASCGNPRLGPAEIEITVSVAVSGVLLASQQARKEQFAGIAKVVGAGLLGGLLGGLIG